MELLTLRECHCGNGKIILRQVTNTCCEIRCQRCADFVWGNTFDYAVKRWNEMQEKAKGYKESVSQPDTVKDCCKYVKNLTELKDDRKGVNTRVCKICGCKHIRFKVDPIELGLSN